jgi:voltage-gated potassium channel
MLHRLIKLNFYDITVIIITIFILSALLFDTFLDLPIEVSKIIKYADWAVCIFFFYDFMLNLISSKNKIRYLYTWGWLDFLAALPVISILRYGKFLRLIRLLKIFKFAYHKGDYVLQINKRDLPSTIFIIAVLTFMVIMCSSIAILYFETAAHSNIKTAEDALWWSIVTITTVGYGDFYPVTNLGRLVAIILLFLGVSLFFTLVGLIVPFFARYDKEEKDIDK